jgi:tRNA-2-methylthio-N6-dimethylallyladenosine synthase
MNRKHTIEEYLEIIEKLKKAKPNIKFSSDFIIGYPGETDEDFDQTVELVKKVKFINSYSFVFSARPGTPAFNLKSINQHITKERLMKFQNICKMIKTEYRETLLSKKLKVLFENKTKNGNKYFGRDEYYNSVIVESNENLIGKTMNTKITNVNQNTLFGVIISKQNQAEFAA